MNTTSAKTSTYDIAHHDIGLSYKWHGMRHPGVRRVRELLHRVGLCQHRDYPVRGLRERPQDTEQRGQVCMSIVWCSAGSGVHIALDCRARMVLAFIFPLVGDGTICIVVLVTSLSPDPGKVGHERPRGCLVHTSVLRFAWRSCHDGGLPPTPLTPFSVKRGGI